jgi:hypothetical protein
MPILGRDQRQVSRDGEDGSRSVLGLKPLNIINSSGAGRSYRDCDRVLLLRLRLQPRSAPPLRSLWLQRLYPQDNQFPVLSNLPRPSAANGQWSALRRAKRTALRIVRGTETASGSFLKYQRVQDAASSGGEPCTSASEKRNASL